ncbi:cholesterol oxidase substrate-binding domain-containing protein [Catenuloplanes atrovinosus]|uniref:FAD/FMN-containing dehydrogenase n=1 Tax=Catenuloplanes atrovinosus TaxID=137266 RepID=A0AAE4C9S9_9ACTN|nr:cholesterol oxidase substrate-binding domain-containing protein [Catenuloplanes atrovinosus]MDR7276147.1 FAD/FMN-containing dehydrogenase [Catenuloplanes atrovinosus]
MGMTRRTLLTGSAAAGLMWTPIGRLADPGPEPPGFPADIPHERRTYLNWSGETVADDVWTASPRTPADVVTLANWAHARGWRLRPHGFRHGWSPLTLAPGDDADVVLLDMTAHLTAMSMTAADEVRVQAGASMESLLTYLEEKGRGLAHCPAPGDLSVGGVLAIGGHGTAVPATGETRAPGTTYGSLSNLVTSVTAVVWDGSSYALRTVPRSDPDAAALLTDLGVLCLVEVTMRVGVNANLRCLSRVDLAASELFAAPGTDGDTVESFLDQAGRIEVIWFAFTTHPWLKVWSVAPTRPLTSRPVVAPYNYPFSDNIPRPVAEVAGDILSGQYYLAPVLGQLQYDATVAGLTASVSADLWGPSKNLLLYIKPTTLRVHPNGYAVLTRRADVQWVLHEFATEYERLLKAYAAEGRFPVNGAVEIRVTGLDVAADAEVPGAEPPLLSAVTPHPGFDAAVWLDVLTLPGTRDANAFYADLEAFCYAAFSGGRALTRVEWSKGWAYTPAAPWTNQPLLTQTIPASFGPSWDRAVSELSALDPHGVFRNGFVDALFS